MYNLEILLQYLLPKIVFGIKKKNLKYFFLIITYFTNYSLAN